MKNSKPYFKSVPEKETARMSREFVALLGKGELDSTPNTIRMIFYMSPYVDFDGKVHMKKEEIKRILNVDMKSFKFAYKRALKNELIEEKNGCIYSLVHTFQKSSDFTFIPNFKRLVSGNFPSLKLRTMQLFAYFMSSKPKGYHRVNFENLYRNKLHTSDNGLDYFHDAKELISALVELLKYDLIEIRLTSLGTTLDKQNIKYHRALLEEYVGIYTTTEKDSFSKHRKIRTSLNRVHTIDVNLSSSLTEEKVKVKASEQELNLLLQEHYSGADLLKVNTINGLIGYKNELYKAVGLTGIGLYRESISTYLSEKWQLIDLHDARDFGLQDHYMNYYLLPAIEDVLLQVAKEIKAMKNPRPSIKFSTPFGNLSFNEVSGLLSFYNKYASKNHIVIFENQLHQLGISQEDLNKILLPWFNIYEVARYVQIELVHQYDIQLSKSDLRAFTYEAAKEYLLTQKEKYEKYITQFKNSQSLYYDVAVSGESFSIHLDNAAATKRSSRLEDFTNWLEEKA